jgi:hypothetical protein
MSVLSPNDCRQAIQALLLTVPNIGQVHTRRRVVRDEQTLKTYLWDDVNGRICGWFISPARAGTVQTERHPGYIGHGAKGGGNVFSTFRFQIEGIFGLNDAADSETTFSSLVYAVADEFEAYGSIPAAGGGMIPGLVEQLPISVEEFGYVAFAGAPLCHYTRMEIAFRGRTRPA